MSGPVQPAKRVYGAESSARAYQNGNQRGKAPPSPMDRLPPQAVEIEQEVLGACLIRRAAVAQAAAILAEDAWYHGSHARIWAAILALEARDEAVDQVTVAEELKRLGQLEQCGGKVYLAELAAGVASAANVEHHARIVASRHLLRRVIEVGAGMSQDAYEPDAEAEEIVTRASEALFALLDQGRRGGFVRVEQIMHDAMEAAERAKASGGGLTGVDTGLVDLNELTGGWQPADLIVLAARPSVGKSALALGAGVHAALHAGVGVGVFSLEMSNLQVGQRLLALGARVSLQRLRLGRMGEAEWAKVTRETPRLAAAPIWVDDSAILTVLEIRTRARQLKQRHGIGLVIVDYLQLGSAPERGSSYEQEVSRISRGLKALAKELNVPVLALSQLSRAPEARSDHRPQLSDLRGSGSIEQDADVVMFLYRPSKDEGTVEVLLRKQRHGPTGDVRVHFDAETASFENLAPEFRIEQEQVERWDQR